MSDGEERGRPPAERPGLFATTHWSLILAASAADTTAAAAAREQLCKTYWRPVYVHVRSQGYREEDARDLTQEFFAQLLREHTLAAADRTRARFRCFLLGVLRRFLAHARAHALAQKRGGGRTIVSWEQDVAESTALSEAENGDSPDRAFDRHWALALVQAAHDRVRVEHAAAGRPGFEVLQPYITAEPDTPSYAATAARLGISEAAVKSAIHRLRQRYFAAVREEVARTVAQPSELEDELRYLRAILREHGPAP